MMNEGIIVAKLVTGETVIGQDSETSILSACVIEIFVRGENEIGVQISPYGFPFIMDADKQCPIDKKHILYVYDNNAVGVKLDDIVKRYRALLSNIVLPNDPKIIR